MDQVTVGLDIGTTSTKAVAVDAAGTVLRRARITHGVVVPAPDRMEHDADRAWRRGPLRALAALGDVQPVALAVTSMMPSVTAVDAKGRPMTAGLLYGDSRGRSGPAISALAEGGPGTSGAEVAGFLSWAASQVPDAHGYWPAQAVANRALGAAPAVDMIVAFIAAPIYGPDGWDPDLCAACGVRPDQLPTVDAPGAPVGRLGGGAEGPIVAAGTADVWCEHLVAGVGAAGDVHVVLGSTLIVWAIDNAAATGEPHPGLWSVPLGDPNLKMVGGASNAGGLFLDWAGRLVGSRGRRREAERVDPADVPVWVPYPRGERTPYHDPYRRAALHEINLGHGPAAIERAAWEATGFVVRHHLDLSAAPAKRIVATGGGTQVAGLVEALAYTTGLPVHVASDPEGAARGAAFVARHAAGLETNFDDARRWASTGRVVEPDPTWSNHANLRYQRFLELSGPPSRPQPIAEAPA